MPDPIDLARLRNRLREMDPDERAEVVVTLALAARRGLIFEVARHTCSPTDTLGMPDATCRQCLVLAALSRVGM